MKLNELNRGLENSEALQFQIKFYVTFNKIEASFCICVNMGLCESIGFICEFIFNMKGLWIKCYVDLDWFLAVDWFGIWIWLSNELRPKEKQPKYFFSWEKNF